MQDLVGIQILAGGNTLGTAAGAAADNFKGCTFTRTGAGAYTVLFDVEPPALTTPKNVIIVASPLVTDEAIVGLIITKTVDGSGNCTGFTVGTTGAADTAWGFVAFRFAQAT